MFTGYQVTSLFLEFVVTIVAVWGIVAKSQSSMKADLQKAIGTLSEAHGKSVEESRQQSTVMNEGFKQVGLQINTIMEGHVRELQQRVTRLESGQDEWTKELRQRTHDLAGKVDQLGFAIELIKAKRGEAKT
jgi:hypothetical protein